MRFRVTHLKHPRLLFAKAWFKVYAVGRPLAQPALYFPIFFLLSFLWPLQRLTQHWQSFCSFEVLKLAWVQVLAFLIPTWVVVEWLKAKLLLESVAGPRPTK